MSLSALSPRQKAIFDYIRTCIAECGYPPTIREIGAHMGIRSTNGVAEHLKALQRKGYLSQAGSKSRTWQPLKAASKATISIPILGRVAAGQPILAEEQAEGTLQLDPALLPKGEPLFALHVVGQSMVEAGIADGDVIFVRKQAQALAGDIVVIMVDDEATVKRYYPEPHCIRLEPANSAMQPMLLYPEPGRRIQIMGVVVGTFRRF